MTAARQASLSITNSWSLFKLMSIESVMPSNHLILCHPLLLSPSIFPSIRVFYNESVLHIRWPKYWRRSLVEAKDSEKHTHTHTYGWSSSFVDLYWWICLLAEMYFYSPNQSMLTCFHGHLQTCRVVETDTRMCMLPAEVEQSDTLSVFLFQLSHHKQVSFSRCT